MPDALVERAPSHALGGFLGPGRAAAGLSAAAFAAVAAGMLGYPSLWVVSAAALAVGLDGIRQASRPASPVPSILGDIAAVAVAMGLGRLPLLVLVPVTAYLAVLCGLTAPRSAGSWLLALAGGSAVLVTWMRWGDPGPWTPTESNLLVVGISTAFPIATLWIAASLARVTSDLRRADRDRVRATERLATVVDALPAFSVVVDSAGRIVSVGGGGLGGDAASELEGRTLDGLPARLAPLGRSLHQEGASRLELWGRSWDVHTARVGDETVLVGLDATSAEEARRALEERERWYRSLIEHGHDVLVVTDPRGVLTYVGGPVETMLGYRPEEMVGRPAVEFIHPDDAPYAAEPFREMQRRGERRGACEWRVRHADGSYRILEATISDRRDDPAVGGWVLNERDVTERRRAEETLRRRNRELAAFHRITEATLAAGALDDAIGLVMKEVVDLTGFPVVTIEVLSEGGHRLTALGSLGRDMGPEEMAVADTVWSKHILAAGRPLVQRLPCEGPPCSHPYGAHTVVGAPMLVDGEPIGVVCLEHPDDRVVDPELVELVGALAAHLGSLVYRRRAQTRLEHLLQAKDEFIASASHELRTPLTSVVGLSRELADSAGCFDPAETAELATLVAEQSAEVAFLVEDLLVAARADAGDLTVEPEALDLAAEAERVVARELGKASSVELELAPVSVWADPTRTRQVIRNLVTNALRYGGARVAVSTGAANGGAWLRVVDDGPGVGEDEQEAVFEPYHRSGAGSRPPGSIGLGLAVARRLARMMGGDVVYRREDGLTVFELRLPAT